MPAIQWYDATGGMTRLVASMVATSRRVLGPRAMRAQASSDVPASGKAAERVFDAVAVDRYTTLEEGSGNAK